MLHFSVSGDLVADTGGFSGLTAVRGPFENLTRADDLLDRLADLDLSSLAEEARIIMVEDAKERARAGGDVDGVPLVPLRRRRPSGDPQGDDPPLAGVGDALVVEVLHGPDGEILVRGTWPTMPFLHYHAEGAGHDPVRRVVGLSDEARDRLREAARDFALGLLGRS
jgi:hypothetical protein